MQRVNVIVILNGFHYGGSGRGGPGWLRAAPAKNDFSYQNLVKNILSKVTLSTQTLKSLSMMRGH
jgi:hypothetical protein